MHQISLHQDLPPKLRIYVSSLRDYNNGLLHGIWIDVGSDARTRKQRVEEMLAASPSASAEEWAIHDYEGFGHIRLAENTRLETVAMISDGLCAHGDAFGSWLACFGDPSYEHAGGFEETYIAGYGSIEPCLENEQPAPGTNQALHLLWLATPPPSICAPIAPAGQRCAIVDRKSGRTHMFRWLDPID